jgi:hypothetical protein
VLWPSRCVDGLDHRLYILEDSDTKLLIVATEAIYEKTKGYAGTLHYTATG